MKWSRLKSREKRLLVVTAAMAFGLANYFVVVPWWHYTRQRAHEVKKIHSEITYREKVLQNVPGWRKALDHLTIEKDARASHIGSQEMWMKHFEELANESGVELIQRRSIKPEDRVNVNQLRVECSLQGSFEMVVRFLWSLLADGSHPQVESCQLSPTRLGEDKLRGQLTLVVELKGSPEQ